MHSRQLVVIGTSAGGIEALREVIGRLPATFPVAIVVVMHTAPQSPGVLHEILARSGPLAAINPRSRERLKPATVYVAPPDHHLLVEPGHLRVTRGPKENRFRPAIDPLFRSAAQVFGPGAIGVILTGNLDDGSAGLWTIKQLGGIAIVQDPDDALFPSMPQSALASVTVDHVVPLTEIAPLLVRLTAIEQPEAEPVAVPERVEVEVKIASEEDPLQSGIERLGEPSTFACPECHGVLREVEEGGRVRFRCHTGHAYSADSLLAEMSESIEGALWNAMRVMHEGDLLMRRMAAHIDAAQAPADAARLRDQADELLRKATVLRKLVTAESATAPGKP
jgi:two-component system, chemotaxis family, protein-glutamate methylesterase/glutaminase